MGSTSLKQGMFFGRWKLIKKIGKGGNGEVWQAQGESNQVVAIKFLSDGFLKSTRAGGKQNKNQKRLKRFQDEISILSSHKDTPGIPSIVDYRMPEKPSMTDRPWFVTKLGVPVLEWIRTRDDRLTEAVRIVCSVADTLAILHDRKVYHRDIKPSNILVVDDVPTVIDFGLVTFPKKQEVTHTSELVGSRFYIAPEMLTKRKIQDASAADVYSLAKTFWVLATGEELPKPGEQRITEPDLTLSHHIDNPHSESLDFLICKATKHDPRERITMRQLHTELEAWLTRGTAPESVEKRISGLAYRFNKIDFRHTEAREQIAEKQCSIRRLVEHASALMQPLLIELKKLTITDFEGKPLPPGLAVVDSRPAIWDCGPSIPSLADRVNYVCSACLVQQFCGLQGRSICYSGGLRIAMNNNGEVKLTMAHAYGSINGDAAQYQNAFWLRELSDDSDNIVLPSAEKKAFDLIAEFIDLFPDALEGALQLFEQIGKTKPP